LKRSFGRACRNARGDASEVLKSAVASLNDVAALIGFLVVSDAFLAVRPARDNGCDAVLPECPAELLAVISLVAKQLLDAGHQAHALRPHRAVGNVARGQNDHPRTAEPIDKRMNLGVPATPRDADRLFGRPPLPPPAQRCALTCVLSSATCSGGAGDPATVSKIC
jgi:hypothetical protein